MSISLYITDAYTPIYTHTERESERERKKESERENWLYPDSPHLQEPYPESPGYQYSINIYGLLEDEDEG